MGKGCIGSVLKAQQAPKEEKGKWMHRHKSLGLLTGMIVAPRFGYRILARSSGYRVQDMVGNSALENVAGKMTHYFLYFFMTAMPATGIAMGLYGGKGLPFFGTHIAGFEKTNGSIAKKSFQIHKQLGTYGKFVVPLHASAAFLHFFRGQTIFARINPLRTPRG